MSTKQLYSVVIWKRDKKEPKNDTVLINIDNVEATSAENAKVVAIRKLTDEQAADLDALDIQVRNF